MVKYRNTPVPEGTSDDPVAAIDIDGAEAAAPAAAYLQREWLNTWRPAPQASVEVRWSSAPDDGFEVSLWFAERTSTRRKTPVPAEKFALIVQGRLDRDTRELPFSLRSEGDPQPLLRGMFVWNQGRLPELWLVDLVYPGGRVPRVCLSDHIEAQAH